MFLPITSTSQLRYLPYATVTMIVINIIAFVIQHLLPDIPHSDELIELVDRLVDEMVELDSAERFRLAATLSRPQPGWMPYTLSHGDGLHPVQWITSMFMHVGVVHLIGNLVFLWVFGHIVEGVVGHKMFALLYVGLGVFGNILEQVAFLAIPSAPSLGASGAIYTLMLLAAWFSPHDHVQGILLLIFRVMFIEVPVLLMAAFYFMWDMAWAMMNHLEMSTPLLHAIGGVIGLIAGYLLLRYRFVENDGQDALTLLRSIWNDASEPVKRQPKTKNESVTKKTQMATDARAMARSQTSFDKHAKARNLEEANHQLRQMRQIDPHFKPEEEVLLHMISAAQKQERWNEVVKLSDQYLSNYSHRAVAVRLVQASILVSRLGMPMRALKALKPLENQTLDPKQSHTAKRIEQQCQKSLNDGTLEADT
ncbi:MAG TPA: rhomboid family intramembrane serine protease [Pirellulaceae bacterium]|nr:rhomboid family intramembrane serine protease [Pirellulaceae bacterium]HMO94392.1 rhomboid family intramembrane serine protease [Pirellulaceae bacterium]HMP71457.1 rhomboid family intramembrane serine protease [Pirellulaceae bacterium]